MLCHRYSIKHYSVLICCSNADVDYVHYITRGSHNTSSVAGLHEEIIMKTVMLPQSAKNESAPYRLGYALTVPWTATRSRTDRDSSYRGRNKRNVQGVRCAMSRDESVLTPAQSAIVRISQFRFRDIAPNANYLSFTFRYQLCETARKRYSKHRMTFDIRIREISPRNAVLII